MGSSVIGRVKCWMRPEAHGEFTEMIEINNGGTFNATSLKMNLLMVFFQSLDLLMVWIQFSLFEKIGDSSVVKITSSFSHYPCYWFM